MGSGKRNEDEQFLINVKRQSNVQRIALIVSLIVFFVIGLLIGAFAVGKKSSAAPPSPTTTVPPITTPTPPPSQLFQLVNNRPNISTLLKCGKTPNNLKIDCYPNNIMVTEEYCLKRDCCWDDTIPEPPSRKEGPANKPPPYIPKCYFPQDYPQYVLKDHLIQNNVFTGNLLKTGKEAFIGKEINNLTIRMTADSNNRLRIKINDLENERFQVPYPSINSSAPSTATEPNYYVIINSNPFNFAVVRRDNNKIIFDSSVGILIFDDQFIQLTAKVSSPYIYGLGETHDNFLHSMYWTRYIMWNHDNAPTDNNNLYGSHPFYLNMEEDGKANGVFLLNSNAMDITLQPTPALTYRTIGGILDFFFFLGPGPQDVISQYTELVGRPFLPPYWSLGFHLCRYNYLTLNRTKYIWKRNVDAGVPFDTQWNDIDYMDAYKDFTVDKQNFSGLDTFVDELHNEHGMHYMVIIDPGISSNETNGTYPAFDEGVRQNVFIKDKNDNLFEGKVWNKGNTVWVDFTHPNATEYWTDQFKIFYQLVKIDGAWIDMNEPANFYNGTFTGCSNSTLDYPPFLPDVETGSLFYQTVCPSAKQHLGVHYNLHNLYGISESISTQSAVISMLGGNRRPFIISRANSPGLGKYSGHWTGDIYSTFDEMRRTVPALLNFNIFGIPMIGADICGFHNDTTEELCQRWHEVGAFYPFSRNHNDKDFVDQDPMGFNGSYLNSTITALTARYSLLPYLYTLFYRSHLFGETVVRGLFFEYPMDKTSYLVDEQFLWGPALLISPILYEKTTEGKFYFPNDIWYDFWSGQALTSSGVYISLYTPLEKINLHVRGGYILPMQQPSQTTTTSRKNGFWLLVALCEKKTASGELYWDHGDKLDAWEKGEVNIIKFNVENNHLKSENVKFGYTEEEMKLNNVTIFGVDTEPKTVLVNNKNQTFKYSSNTMVLYVTNFSAPLRENFTLSWS